MVMKDRCLFLVTESEQKGADVGATFLDTCSSIAIPQYEIIGMAADVVTNKSSETTQDLRR
jgi:hypothetical protein